MSLYRHLYVIGFLICLALLGLGLVFGEVSLRPEDWMAAISQPRSDPALIVWSIRLPRNLCALMVGAMLGASGAIMQGLLRNPLAEPGLLGVSSGAGLGAALAIVLGLGLVPYAVEGLSLIFAFLALAILVVLASKLANSSALILSGVALSSFLGAVMSLVFNLSPSPVSTTEILNWMMGNVANRDLKDVAICALALIIAGLMMPRLRLGLRALSLGEDTARSLGVDLKSLYIWALVAASLLSGISVAMAGIIGFVGLCAPHMVRSLGIKDPYSLIWPSALMGAIMVLGADIITRLIPLDQPLRLGVLTSLVGAPVFAVIARSVARSWGGGYGDKP